MTANQWRMLDILSTCGGMGTIEVEIQWGGYDFGESEREESRAWACCRMVCQNLVRSLVKRGYATDDHDGYGITDAGREALKRHESKVK